MVDSSRPGQWNVLELSSFQLETIERFRARIGVALNVTQDHLDRHHTFSNYAAAKARLFETQQPGDFAVLNADDPAAVGLRVVARAAGAFWFSLTRAVAPGIWLDGGRLLFDGQPFLDVRRDPAARPAQRRERHGGCRGGAPGRRAARRHRSAPSGPSRPSSTGSSSCAPSAASTSTTTRKPPTWIPTLKAIEAFAARCG